MPSINMKLEMVTIIACEVDIEVFTSDKMQVRFTHKKCTLKWSLLFAVCCAAVCSGRLHAAPVEAHECLGWRWMQPFLKRGFLSMGAASRGDARAAPRVHAAVIDAEWIAKIAEKCTNVFLRNHCVCVSVCVLQIDGNYKMRLARRYWNGVWWSGLSMQDTCMEISEAMLRRSGEQAVLYPPPSVLYLALQQHCRYIRLNVMPEKNIKITWWTWINMQWHKKSWYKWLKLMP